MVLSSAAASTQTTILPTAADHAVHGGVQGHPERVLQDPQALPDADDVDADHGRRLHRALRDDELPVQRQRRDLRTRCPPWACGSPSTTASPGSRAPGTTAARCARAPATSGCAASCRWPGWLMLWFAMGWAFWYYWKPVNSYTSWTMPTHPLAHRRRLRPRRRCRPPRHRAHGRLRPAAPGLLPGRGPQPRHADPGARRTSGPRSGCSGSSPSTGEAPQAEETDKEPTGAG